MEFIFSIFNLIQCKYLFEVHLLAQKNKDKNIDYVNLDQKKSIEQEDL